MRKRSGLLQSRSGVRWRCGMLRRRRNGRSLRGLGCRAVSSFRAIFGKSWIGYIELVAPGYSVFDTFVCSWIGWLRSVLFSAAAWFLRRLDCGEGRTTDCYTVSCENMAGICIRRSLGSFERREFRRVCSVRVASNVSFILALVPFGRARLPASVYFWLWNAERYTKMAKMDVGITTTVRSSGSRPF